MEIIEVAAGVVRRADGRVLICRRTGRLEGLWEFPGGKIEAGETGEQCIVRECQEELGVTLSVERELTDITYEYPDRIIHLHFYLCGIAAGALEKKEHNAIAWIDPDEVDQYELCPADQAMICKFRNNPSTLL